MNKEIEEVIKDCEEIIKSNNAVIKEARKNGDINVMQLTSSLDRESKAIETIINSYNREKARADKLESEYSKMLTKLDQYKADSTPKSVIREKIEELQHKLSKTYNLFGASDYEFIKCEAKIEILQEILKEGEK